MEVFPYCLTYNNVKCLTLLRSFIKKRLYKTPAMSRNRHFKSGMVLQWSGTSSNNVLEFCWSFKIAKTNAEGRMHNGRVKGLQGSRVVPPFRPLPPASPSAVRASAAIHNMRAPSLSQQPVVVVPAFQALPQSIVQAANSPMAPRQPAPQAFQSALQMANRRFQVVVPDMPSSNALPSSMAKPENAVPENTLTVRTLQSPPSQSKPTVISTVDIHAPNPMLLGHSISSLAQASNISVETLAAAIKLKQEQLRVSITTTTTTTTTSTTPQPVVTRPSTVKPRYSLAGPSKVMNAPKEYYPVAYDKNYDDNFTSKVELPDTSFSCGDQKHFPGLYADEDLGCMVFHVCAFTDDGLVMKSFLCPESTLFDQTILKCNWWFYVDCKSSRKLYDSNIPISKSYQLMKALAFFSTYRNQTANAT
ncbi:hypothetical protein J6590_077396 [Homalodisca vitripennis]|nr:hypothetical protein J6590_077396 [Homalodisca vitripennis]